MTQPQSTKIVYYCKDCAKIVQAKPVGKTYVYRCSLCGTKNVAFGTEKSIRNFYHVEEESEAKEAEESPKGPFGADVPSVTDNTQPQDTNNPL